jgi:hypothetical protein
VMDEPDGLARFSNVQMISWHAKPGRSSSLARRVLSLVCLQPHLISPLRRFLPCRLCHGSGVFQVKPPSPPLSCAPLGLCSTLCISHIAAYLIWLLISRDISRTNPNSLILCSSLSKQVGDGGVESLCYRNYCSRFDWL